MAPRRTFPQFADLPENIRNNIWEKAADTILATRSLHFMNLSRYDVDEPHENSLILRARAAAMASAQGPARVTREIWAAIRTYRATLVNATPRVESSQLATFSASWKFSDVASACTDAYQSIRRRLEADGNRRRDGGVSAVFIPTRDIVCLEGPETLDNSTWFFRFFANVVADNGIPDDQVVLVGSGEDRLNARELDEDEYTKCSSLCEICPALAPLKRVAFIYPTAGDDFIEATTYHHRLGLAALWPHNLPELRQIYLIDTSIKMNAMVSHPQRLLRSIPSFAGCLGTFYEVRPDNSDDDCLWDIWTTETQLLPIFRCATSLESEYKICAMRMGSVPKITVNVLAFIPHSQQ